MSICHKINGKINENESKDKQNMKHINQFVATDFFLEVAMPLFEC